MQQVSAPAPDIVIVDMQQLLYHIIWPHGGDASDLGDNIKNRLSCYPIGTEQVIVFDRYNDLSAKDHERMRRAGEGSTYYNLTTNSPLPNRDAIIKNKHNKRELSRVISTFNLGPDTIMDSEDDGGFAHEEADVTMVSYMLQAAECGKGIIRLFSDDTDFFVM